MQIPVCRSVLSVGKVVPDMQLGKGLESKPETPMDEFVQIGIMDTTTGRKGLSRGSCKATLPFS